MSKARFRGAIPVSLLAALQRDLGPRSAWGRFLRTRAAADFELFALIQDNPRFVGMQLW